MKKQLALLLSVCLLFSLSACTLEPKNGGAAGESSTIEGGSANGSAVAEQRISKGKALEIALQNAGVKQEEIRQLETELDEDDGLWLWEIEFETADGEHEFDIHAYSGEVLKHERPGSAPSGTGSAPSKERLTEAQALDIAFQKADVSREQIRDLEVELDEDDGLWLWEIEFEVGDDEYEFDIHAYSGQILKQELPDKAAANGSGAQRLTKDAALDIALKRIAVKKEDIRALEAELDEDDGDWLWEIEFEHGDDEYEFDIHAYSGKILKEEVDKD